MHIKESIYISLQEASHCCDYSQEYLSLRARQGKLKSIKFGRNWVTKKEWLEEYLRRVKECNDNFRPQRFIVPPANLPIERMPSLRFGFVAALVFVLIITGIFHNRAVFQNVYRDALPLVAEIGKIVFEEVEEGVSQVASIEGLFEGYVQRILVFRGRVSDIVFDAAKTVEQKILAFRDRVYYAWQFVSRPWREDLPERDRIVKDEVLRPKPEDGVVIVPHTERELAQIREQLEKAFSDRVEVEPDETGRAGIIKPLIREVAAEEYLYLIVPVKE